MMDELPFHQDGSTIARVVSNILNCRYPNIPTRTVLGPSTVSTLTVPRPVKFVILECWKRAPHYRIPISNAVDKLEEVSSPVSLSVAVPVLRFTLPPLSDHYKVQQRW